MPLTRMLNNKQITVQQVEDLMAAGNINCIASGQQDFTMKFYFFARAVIITQAESRAAFLIEMVIELDAREVSYKVKTQDPSLGRDFLIRLNNTLTPIIS